MLKICKNAAKVFLLSFITLLTLMFCLQFSVNAQAASNVEDLVKSLSGGKLKVETRARPYKLSADFNGDKVEDTAVIVELLDSPKSISPTVKKAYPYYLNSVAKNDLVMLIIHGTGKGWEFAQKESILLLGHNSALVFEKERFNEQGDSVEIEKDKRGKVRLFFSTEGAEGYLKWNGKRYVWWETQP